MKKLSKLKLENATLMTDSEMKNIVGGYGVDGLCSASYKCTDRFTVSCTATKESEKCGCSTDTRGGVYCGSTVVLCS